MSETKEAYEHRQNVGGVQGGGNPLSVEEQLEEVLRRVKEMGSTAASECKGYWEARCATYRAEALERAGTISDVQEEVVANEKKYYQELHAKSIIARENTLLIKEKSEMADTIAELREQLEVKQSMLDSWTVTKQAIQDAKLGALVRQVRERELS